MGKTELFIGVDIGGTNTEVGFVDISGKMVHCTSFSTSAQEVASQFVNRLGNVIHEGVGHLEERYVCKGVGIAAPNANNFHGTIECPVNLGWGTVNLVELLGERVTVPIRVINDANAAALGEMEFGAAKGMRNFVVITLGTGLGSGIVIHGEILNGAHGLAGELGHTMVVAGGRDCGCGKTGCLETYVSANGIRRTALVLMGRKFYKSELTKVSFAEMTAKAISDAALAGDQLALDVLEQTGKVLGRKLADVVAFCDPEAFVIMGGVANAGELLLEPTRRYCIGNLLPAHKGRVCILQSKMKPGEPAVLGAAMLMKKK